MFENLYNTLSQIHPLSEELKNQLSLILKVKTLDKKDFILKNGQVCDYIYFIEKGLLRCYYEKYDEHITSWFMKENDVIISVKSFFSREKSYENIIALEPSVLYGIHYDELNLLYKQFPEFNIVGRELITKYYILSEERLYGMRKERAADRYAFLSAYL